MNPVSILFFVFSLCIFLVGLYMFQGNEFKMISWKAAFKSCKREDWINIGKWTMITSIIPFIIAILLLFVGD